MVRDVTDTKASKGDTRGFALFRVDTFRPIQGASEAYWVLPSGAEGLTEVREWCRARNAQGTAAGFRMLVAYMTEAQLRQLVDNGTRALEGAGEP
jgi:hypothetical protein